MPPEACDVEVEHISGKAADLWALGVTLYAMMFNCVPFMAETEYKIMETIRTSEVKIPADLRPELASELFQLLE